MTAKAVSAFFLLFTALGVSAQTAPRKKPTPKPTVQTASPAADGELQKHLSAAETYQLTGDIYRAEPENKAVVAIALQRLGMLALEEENFQKAVEYLNKSAGFAENSLTRAGLAVAYMRLDETEKAIAEAQTAIALDDKNFRAYQILGSLYYAKGDYQNALPALEKVLRLAPDFDGAYLLGMTYLHLKQPARAKLLFEEIQTAVKRDSVSLYMMFGRAFEETDYPLEAEREYKRALAVNPQEAKVNFYLGFVIMQNGGAERLAEAAGFFERELAVSPQDFYSYFFLGVVYSSLNDHQKAVRYLQKAVALSPKKGQSYLFLGQSQAELGDLANAEKNLRRAIELTADASKDDFQVRRAHFQLGRLLIKAGKKEEGEKELAAARQIQGQLFERDRSEVSKILGQVAEEKNAAPQKAAVAATVKLAPQKAAEFAQTKSYLAGVLGQAYNNLGVIAVQQGNLADSLEKFSAAAKWKPNLAGLDRNWGIVAFRLNQFEQAAPPLARHLKINPNDNLARRMLGVSYYFSKNFKQAAATLKPIEIEIGDDAELTYFYGVSLVQSELDKDAETVFNRLGAQHQKNAQARFYAAQGFVLTGNFEKAAQEFRAVAALDPTFEKAHYNAGQSLIRLNRLDEAEQEFRRELEINAADELAKYHLAFTLLERKIRLDEAFKLLNEAILTKPDYADAHYQLGKIYNEKGETEKAIAHLEKSVQIDPNKDYSHYQLSIAYRRAARLADAERELKIYRELKAANRQLNSPMGNK